MTRIGFAWSSSFAIDVPVIDGQHQRLIELLNDVMVAKGKQEAESLITGMIDYTATHFQTEEALMRRHGYPRIDAHTAEHQHLLRRVEAVRDALTDPAIRLGQIRNLLVDWLTGHILSNEFDQDLGRFLKANGIAEHAHSV